MPSQNYVCVSAELIRKIRGERSQNALNRRLGYKHNYISKWERGAARMKWPTFVRLCQTCRAPLAAVLKLAANYDDAPEDGRKLLKRLVGNLHSSPIAGEGVSLSKASRMLNGKQVPFLDDILQIMDAYKDCLSLFIETLTGDPALRQKSWRDGERARIWEEPLSLAIMQALTLPAYTRRPNHKRGLLAEAIGCSMAEEERLLNFLKANGMIERQDGRYKCVNTGPISVRGLPEEMGKFRASWMERVTPLGRCLDPDRHKSLMGNVVFAVSEAGFHRLKDLYFKFHHDVRTILQGDEPPSEIVGLINLHLVDLQEVGSDPPPAQ